MPAREFFRRHRLAAGGRRQRPLQQVIALVEVPTRVHRERAGHPEVVQTVLHRPPPPPPAPAARPAPLEVCAAHGSIGRDGGLHLGQHLGIAAQPVGPARVPRAVVEHGAPPPRQRGCRDQARGVGPVLEEQPPAIDEPIEPRAVVRSKAAPDREVVGTVEHVDGVELQAAHVLDEAAQPAGAQGDRPGPGEMLALQKERPDGVQGDRATRHAPGDYHRGRIPAWPVASTPRSGSSTRST